MENKIEILSQKEDIAQTLYEVFNALNTHFSWTFIEIFISMKVRLGDDNPYISYVLKDLYSSINKEELEAHLPECSEDNVDIADLSLGSINPRNYNDYSKAFAKSMMNVNMNIPEECQPWDIQEKNNSDNFVIDENIMIIQNIKMKLSRLAAYKQSIINDKDNFKNEIITIDILFEVLDYNLN